MGYLFLVSCIWAFSFVLIKGVLVGVDSFVVSFLRLFISFVIFLPFLKVKKLETKLIFSLIMCGALQYGVMYIAYISAYNFLPAHIIVLMTVFTPLWVIFFSEIFAHKFSCKFLLVASLAVIGGVLIKYPQGSLVLNLKGILLIQISNIAFALGQVYYKNLLERFFPQDKQYRLFGWLYLGAVLFTLPFYIAGDSICLTSKQMFALLYLGCVASGLCFFWWNKGASMVSSCVLSVMNNVKIPLGILAVLFFLKESFDVFRLLAGTSVILFALYLARKYNKVAVK